ncbi:MAG: hypothetical protein ABSG25_08375, partial [Bryobacteraceae bacterium]
RNAGRPGKAAELLANMEQRVSSPRKADVYSDSVYWYALATLARLYTGQNQTTPALQKLEQMRQFLAESPDRKRAAEFNNLRKLVARRARH